MPPRRLPFVAAATATLLLLLVLLAGATDAAHGGYKKKGKGPPSLAASFLDPHNAARRAVGLGPLAWDERLAAYARRYAAKRSGDCALVHSHGPFGENLFRGSGGAGWRPADVVGAWVRERAVYDARSNTCRGGACGHYTQIVWRRTTAVGCALVPCGGGRGTFGVCSYNPPGNYVGMRPY
ncbi:hypothetical protein PR202_ga02993 [Eleusine coracana subsp. coracana]|uniref:SCP domain-containing protein n=1 Tax=Eleusine coracana subsp. coracana TaxID=191504 RepID=A0AAV5BL80_ELECO|nr:hypothetical protein QOZ80_2AG0148370 [Eleusine coracana subsp. coracana]GJM87075.1 hypothetical protein PR202_ga02993 [Eleusine coracana subsp. coracana]